MSRTTNQALSAWKVVLARLRRTETTWRGLHLSERDHRTFTEAILCNTLVLVDLSNRYPGMGAHRDHVNWAHSCVRVDVDRLAHFLTDAILLFRSLSEGSVQSGIACYADFKRQLSEEYPFTGKLLGTVSGAIDEYIAYPSGATFYPVYQFLSFMTHLSLLDLPMDQELEDEYMSNEKRLEQLALPNEHLLTEMNLVMRRWLKDFHVSDESFRPHHGPGAVAEFTKDRSINSKYHVLSSDALIDYVLGKFAGLDVRTYFPRTPRSDVPTSRESSIVFVPKSMKTRRVISKEPTTLMFLQQGVNRELSALLRRNRYLSDRIDLHDQSLQRDAALEASRTREMATVDLSAASDSVSFDLVKRVFAGTALLPYLVALRSRSARLPSGNVVEMRKFAPMGSALCFPIETLLFACICECTARYVQATSGVSDFRYRVYGDDIIVPDHCYHDLTYLLRQCGFRINGAKSYSGSNRFRESCGCDAYDGVDVTCMKIGRRFASGQVASSSPSLFAGKLDLANTAYKFGFQLLRSYIVHDLVNDTHYIPLFSGDVNVGLYSPNPTNFLSPHRWNKDWQCEEVKVAMVTTQEILPSEAEILKKGSYQPTLLPIDVVVYDDIRYVEWLRLSQDRVHDPHGHYTYSSSRDAFHPDFRVGVKVGSACTKLSMRWVVPA